VFVVRLEEAEVVLGTSGTVVDTVGPASVVEVDFDRAGSALYDVICKILGVR
jgi:hypothetical protein